MSEIWCPLVGHDCGGPGCQWYDEKKLRQCIAVEGAVAIVRVADALERLTASRLEPARLSPPVPYWARVEIMGHSQVIGLVHEERLAGADVLRVEVPEVESKHGAATVWDEEADDYIDRPARTETIPAWQTIVRGASIFRLTRIPEEQARREAAQLGARPFVQPEPEPEPQSPGTHFDRFCINFQEGTPGAGGCEGDGYKDCRRCSKSVRRCRVCGCTERDCSRCIEKTGQPCSWVAKDLCSACVDRVATDSPPFPEAPCGGRVGSELIGTAPLTADEDPGQDDSVLPPGKTCQQCGWWGRCHGLIGLKGTETRCDWSPSRFCETSTPSEAPTPPVSVAPNPEAAGAPPCEGGTNRDLMCSCATDGDPEQEEAPCDGCGMWALPAPRRRLNSPPGECEACRGNVAPGKTCYACGLQGPAGQGTSVVAVEVAVADVPKAAEDAAACNYYRAGRCYRVNRAPGLTYPNCPGRCVHYVEVPF